MKLDPRTRATVLTFAMFNIAWGVMLFFYYPRIPYTVISHYIPQIVWAVLFLLSGLLLLAGGLKQYCKLAYVLMIIGLFTKSLWEVGLLFRLREGGTAPLVLLWGLAFSLQFFAVLFFKEAPDERT